MEIDAPDVDIDMDSPSPSENEGGAAGDESEMEATGAELAPPARETGAETEVEGDGVRRSTNPFDSPLPLETPAEATQLRGDPLAEQVLMPGPSVPVLAVVDEGGMVGLEDADGAISGKRKR